MDFVDIVALLIAHLDPIVSPVPIAARIPAERPTEFVQLRRVGGSPEAPVRERARIDVICWAATEPRAAEIGSTVRSAIWALAGTDTIGVPVYQVTEFLSPRMDDDELTGTPRVWFTLDMAIRADDIIHYH